MTMGAEDDWRLGEPALRSAGVVWSDVVVNVSRQRVSGAEMGIADPRLNLDVEYYCGWGESGSDLFCVETFDEVVNHYLPET
jgi:hypothetical protein